MPGEHLSPGIVILVLAGHAAKLSVLPSVSSVDWISAVKAEILFPWYDVIHSHRIGVFVGQRWQCILANARIVRKTAKIYTFLKNRKKQHPAE